MQVDSRLQKQSVFFFEIDVPVTVSLIFLLVKEQDEQLEQESFNNSIHWNWNKVQAAQ